eukprot:c15496_g1_i1.p1 GENE.c15496_g1_i1~~c15496_g1_i1.p1  ORF type:complete len:281 (+),score=93.32 c15496_g1_i1:45-887(+)
MSEKLSFSAFTAGALSGILLAVIYFKQRKEKEKVKELKEKESDLFSRPIILLFGDSLTQRAFSPTQGWGTSLSEWYVRTCDVSNRGFSGYNTRWAKSLLEVMLPEKNLNLNIQFMTILFGANDSTKPGSAQHIPLDEYKDNIIGMINHMNKVSPKTIIILITPPPVNAEAWRQFRGTEFCDRDISIVKEYANVVRDIGKEKKISIVDLWKGECQIENDDLCDGLHFSESGDKKLFTGLKSLIEEKYPEISPTQLKFHFPLWDVIAQNGSEWKTIVEKWNW